MMPPALAYTDLSAEATLETIISNVLMNPTFAPKVLQDEANVGFKDIQVA
jgi:hypothetical protein